ncbi:MAG: adenosylmethionine-8-amino-7-oxononanoate aminotransferase, partial [Limisphaerales bacterium]
HGHSFTANPLACTVSLASLDLTEKVECIEAVKRIGHRHTEFMERLAQRADCGNIRRTGTIIAFEWTEGQEGNSYFHGMRDFIYNYFIDRGILLRPLGNTIYIMPPYCISDEHLDKLYEGIIGCLDALKEASKNVELA